MKRYLPFAATVFALSVAAAAPAIAGYGSNEQHEFELVAMDQASCASMLQAFDAAHATNAAAVALRDKGAKDCAETNSFATSMGTDELEQALGMIGVKVARANPGQTTFKGGELIE